MTEDKKIQEELSFRVIRKFIACQECGRGPLVALPPNYPTVDIICQFCSNTAQVKTFRTKSEANRLPRNIVSAAWKPQKERMDAGIFQPLYIVSFYDSRPLRAYYLSSKIQKKYQKELFIKRKPLPSYNVRAGF
jgi:type II restriction enzyme